MEFWGVEVKSGEVLKVQPGDDKILHLSQASLGEVKKNKGNESIPLFVKVGGQNLVLGTLSPENCTHIPFDLVFEKEFELSHNWKNGSVYFCGYKSVISDDADDFTESDSELEPDLSLITTENGKPELKNEPTKPTTDKANAAKPDFSAAKPKVKIVEPPKGSKSKKEDDSDDDEDEEDSEEDESDDDEDMLNVGDDSDEDDEESSDEDDEETPKKPEPGKKRPVESATKTPPPEKKAKLITPQKTDGKKGGHTATPNPSKPGKTPTNVDKSKQQTPKSGAQVTCTSCTKSFNSENALQSHTKAKHSAK